VYIVVYFIIDSVWKLWIHSCIMYDTKHKIEMLTVELLCSVQT